jgi:chromatin remodeling complex protein RSC6
LTDKVNKKVIHIDEILRPIFPVETIGMFEMPKYLSKHLARKGKVEV